MKLILQWRRVLFAQLSALHALVLRGVQRVLLLLIHTEMEIVRIYFKYNYI